MLFLVGFLRSFWRDYQIRQEIEKMEATKAELEQKRIKTLDYLHELESGNFAEKEARLNFGLAKTGENVVIITNKIEKEPVAEEKKEENNNKSNFKLWWRYFFAQRN